MKWSVVRLCEEAWQSLTILDTSLGGIFAVGIFTIAYANPLSFAIIHHTRNCSHHTKNCGHSHTNLACTSVTLIGHDVFCLSGRTAVHLFSKNRESERYRLFEADVTLLRDRSDDEVRRLLGSERFFPKNDREPGAAGARPSATPDGFSSDDSTESNFSGFDADAFH